jgi:hypothetical protein
LKVWVDDPETNGHGILPTPLNLHLRVSTFVFREDVQNLLDLHVRLFAAIFPRHNYNRLSTHIMISTAASKKACKRSRGCGVKDVPGSDEVAYNAGS